MKEAAAVLNTSIIVRSRMLSIIDVKVKATTLLVECWLGAHRLPFLDLEPVGG